MTIYNPLYHQVKKVKEEKELQELRIELEEPPAIRKKKQSEEADERGVIVIEMF